MYHKSFITIYYNYKSYINYIFLKTYKVLDKIKIFKNIIYDIPGLKKGSFIK